MGRRAGVPERGGAAEGTIFRRGASWYVDCYVDGSRVRRSAGASKIDARRLLEQLRQQNARGYGYVALSDVLQGYLASLRLRAKPSTVAQAEVQAGTIQRFFGPAFAAASMGAGDLEAFIADRLRTVRPAAANGTLRVLRAALHNAVEHGRLEQLPLRVRMLREPKRLPRILQISDVETLIARARPPFHVVLAFAGYAGLRHGEILHLQRRDVDLEAGTLHVSAKPGWTPKSHAERMVPTAPRLEVILSKYTREIRRPDAWLFSGYEGRPYRSAASAVRSAFKAAGLYNTDAKPGLHQLRRSWASALLANGVDVETVRELGGWVDLATVQRYLASTDGLKRRAVASLG